MQKLVIFDLDGTLLDSLPDIHICVNKTLERFGYPQHTITDVMQFIGNGARNLIKRSLPNGIADQEIDKILAYYNKIYTESGSPETRLFDGIAETVKVFHVRGYKLAILTNKPQITTDAIYRDYMSDLPFDKVVGQREGFKIKPDPTVALSIIEELGAEPQNTYFVGDGDTDVQTAQNAGVNGIATLWGYRSKAQLAAVGATVFAEQPKDLLDIIR